jgi:hypothetical protein
MSTSNLSLWINPRNNTVFSGFNTFTQAPQMVLTQGDDVYVDIHIVDSSGGEAVEIPFQSNSSIKFAIGRIDRFPTSGSFTFQYESDIVQIPIPSSIQSVNLLINSLPSVTADGGVIVYFVNSTTYRVVFNTVGAKSDCVINTTGLYPNSNATVTRITTGTALLNEVQNVKLKTTPVAYSSTFTHAATPTISISEITTSIFRIKISDELKYGSFTISNGTKTTAAIKWDASASELLDALIACGISSSATLTSTRYSVVKNENLSWDISRVNGSYESLLVSAIGFTGFSTMTGLVNMNTLEIEDLLNGATSVTATLEVELTSGLIKQTLYQGEIRIINDLIDNATYSPIQFPDGSGGGLADAPQDGLLYGRMDGNWSVVPETDLTGYATESWVGSQGYVTINGWGTVPDGGLTGQVLTKLSDDNYMLAWTSLPDLSGYATQSWVTSQGYITSSALAPYATLASPALSGVPTAPTPSPADNSTTIATTAYVDNAVASSTTSPSTQKVTKTVKNSTAALIPKRSVVYVDGANGNNTTIALAQANAESTSYRTFGITESDIAINGTGVVVIIGEVLNVDTGLFNDGDQLYLSPTVAGGITNVKPSAPNHLVYVGVVTRANNNNGKIEVNVSNGFELNEIHDVAINGKLNKDLVSYEQSTNLWKNKSAASLGLAELSGATFSGKVNFTSVGGASGLNVGVGGTNTSSTMAGDMWITTGGANLNFRDGTGAWKVLASLQNGNVFTQPQSIQTLETATTTALRVTNRSTQLNAHSLVVEDSLPDSNAFVIDNEGKVGIGVSSTSFSSTYSLTVNGLISSNTAAIKTNNSTVATTSFVRSATVPAIVSVANESYPVTQNIGWNTFVRLYASSYTQVLLYSDNTYNVENGTEIKFVQGGPSLVMFIESGCTIISRDSMRSISGYGGVATLVKIGTNEWVLHGDLAHAPSGFVYSSGCVQSEAADFVGTMWIGYFVHQVVTADGNGGTITSDYPNSNGCWYPNGWVIDYAISSQTFLNWEAYDNFNNILTSGSFAYYTEYGTTFADGSGGTWATGSNTSANAGDVIYGGSYWDSAGQQTIYYSIVYDGNQGYYQI